MRNVPILCQRSRSCPQTRCRSCSVSLNPVATETQNESARLLQSLRQLGCDFGQGYHVGRPMRQDGFDRWMRERLAAKPDGGARAISERTEPVRSTSVG